VAFEHGRGSDALGLCGHSRAVSASAEKDQHEESEMRKIGRLTVALVAASVMIAGCSTMKVGRDFDYNAFGSRVQQGTTDAAQVREWLGEPIGRGVEVNPDGSRNDVWTYYFGTGKIPSGSDVGFKMLQVKVTPEGKVAGYVWTGDLSGAPVEERGTKKK
jgi:predicted small secreted protein